MHKKHPPVAEIKLQQGDFFIHSFGKRGSALPFRIQYASHLLLYHDRQSRAHTAEQLIADAVGALCDIRCGQRAVCAVVDERCNISDRYTLRVGYIYGKLIHAYASDYRNGIFMPFGRLCCRRIVPTEAAQLSFYPRHDLERVKGLRYVIVGADGKSHYPYCCDSFCLRIPSLEFKRILLHGISRFCPMPWGILFSRKE